jgi:hypothetical protein
LYKLLYCNIIGFYHDYSPKNSADAIVGANTSGKESSRGRSPSRVPTPQMGSAVRAIDPPLAAVARSDSHTAINPFGDLSNK